MIKFQILVILPDLIVNDKIMPEWVLKLWCKLTSI